MSFVRGSEGSFLTAAPGTGASAFLDWAAADTLRYEDRGDGAGPLVLLEGGRTNIVVRSHEINSAPWTTYNTCTVTAGQLGPDGTTAERVQVPSGTNLRYQTMSGSSGPWSFSVWGRAASGSIDHNIYLYDGATAEYAGANLSTTYQRLIGNKTIGGGWSGNAACATGEAGVVGAGGRDAYLAHMQVELGLFASSVIRTAGSTAARAADELTASSFHAGLLTTPGRFTEWSPIFASSAHPSGSARKWLLCIDRGDGLDHGIALIHDGSVVRLAVFEDHSVVVQSDALSFAAHDLIGEISWDPAAGTLTVDGDTNTGTPWTWAGGTEIQVGGFLGYSFEAFARFGELRSV